MLLPESIEDGGRAVVFRESAAELLSKVGLICVAGPNVFADRIDGI